MYIKDETCEIYHLCVVDSECQHTSRPIAPPQTRCNPHRQLDLLEEYSEMEEDDIPQRTNREDQTEE